ncbi:MAG: hypothetical protein ACOCWI_02695 [Bacillota bacterium]
MRLTNFANGCFGKVFTAIFCIILGIVLAYGGLAIGGYILVTRDGMVGTAEDYAQEQGLPIDFDEEYRDLSLLEWGQQIFPILGAFSTTPIRELELALGINTLSTTLTDITGMPEDTILDTSLEDFGETFSDNVTLDIASDKFGIEYPTLPIFDDESYLQTPLATALSDLDNFALEDFVVIDETSSPIIQSLADIRIGDLSDSEVGLDNRINSLMLHEVIEIVEEGPDKSNNVLIHLKDVEVGELGSGATNDLIMEMTLEEVIDIDAENKVLYELREKTLSEIGSEDTYNDVLNIPISDLMEIDETSSEILQYFRDNDTTLDGDDGGVNAALQVMTLSDMIEITDPSEPGGSTKLMWALRDAPLETIPADGTNPEILGIEDTLEITSFSDLLETGDAYVWDYLGEATIENIGQKIDDMEMRHVILIDSSSPPILRKMRAYDPEIDSPGEEDLYGTENIKISELNTELEPLVQGMELGELITIDSSSEPILHALENTTIDSLNDKIATLQVNEVFTESEYSTGFLSLIEPTTLIYDVAGELELAVEQARLQRLINIGVVSDFNLNNRDEYNAKMRNSTLSEMVDDFVSIINNPAVIATQMTPERHFLDDVEPDLVSASISVINMDLLDEIPGFEEGDTLVLASDAIIDAEDFTMVFNVITDNHTLTVMPGATVRSQIYDGEEYKDRGGYMFFGTGYYPESSPGAGDDIAGGGSVTDFSNLTPPPGIIDNTEVIVEVDPT